MIIVFKKKSVFRIIPRWEVYLISEDYATVRLMKSYFDSKQFKVCDFVSCSEALKNIINQNPKVILLDKNLPEENRKNFLKRLESDKKLKKIPVKLFAKEEFENKIRFKHEKHDQAYNEDVVDFFRF